MLIDGSQTDIILWRSLHDWANTAGIDPRPPAYQVDH